MSIKAKLFSSLHTTEFVEISYTPNTVSVQVHSTYAKFAIWISIARKIVAEVGRSTKIREKDRIYDGLPPKPVSEPNILL